MIGILYCFGLVASPMAEAASKWSFISKLAKKNRHEITKIAKDLAIKGSKEVPDALTLSRKFNLPAKIFRSPAMRKMALTGEKIVAHGAGSSRMLNQSSMPELVIKQYSRYGKDKYLNVAKAVRKSMTATKKRTSAALNTLQNKYKGMNEVINKYNAGGYNDDIFVRTMKKTGKRGRAIFDWVAKHPKSSAAAAVAAWYLYDPEGFEEALQKSGETLGNFVGESVVNISSGVAEGAGAGLARSFGVHSITSFVVGGVMIGLVLLGALSKTFRRLLLFPFTMLGKKANAKMDSMEDNVTNTHERSHRTDNQSNQSATQRQRPRKPTSNL